MVGPRGRIAAAAVDIDLSVLVGDLGVHRALHDAEALGLAGVDANQGAEHGDVRLVAAEEAEQRTRVIGHTQADAEILAVHHVGHHLLRLGHDGLDELELDLDEHAGQLDGRASKIVGAQFVASVRCLGDVHRGPEGKLRDQRNQHGKRRDSHEQRHSALPIPRLVPPVAAYECRTPRSADSGRAAFREKRHGQDLVGR